jgi:hypothetical protein
MAINKPQPQFKAEVVPVGPGAWRATVTGYRMRRTEYYDDIEDAEQAAQRMLREAIEDYG